MLEFNLINTNVIVFSFLLQITGALINVIRYNLNNNSRLTSNCIVEGRKNGKDYRLFKGQHT